MGFEHGSPAWQTETLPLSQPVLLGVGPINWDCIDQCYNQSISIVHYITIFLVGFTRVVAFLQVPLSELITELVAFIILTVNLATLIVNISAPIRVLVL